MASASSISSDRSTKQDLEIQNVTVGTKAKLFETLVIPVFLYGSGCWCLRQEDERRILVAEMSWIRRILGVSRMERKRNVEIRQQLGLKETVIDRVRKRRFTWFGHVTRMDGNRLPLKALHCYIQGNRSRGRQRKKWIDNVREDLALCNEDLTTATVLARDRSRWRRLVETSSSA